MRAHALLPLSFGRAGRSDFLCRGTSDAITYTLMNTEPAASDRSAPASLDALVALGEGLVRPECVLATASGDLFTADWRGGVAHLRARRLRRRCMPAQPAGRAAAAAQRHRAAAPTAVSCSPTSAMRSAACFGSPAPARYARCCSRSTASTCRRPTSWSRTRAGRVWITVSTRQRRARGPTAPMSPTASSCCVDARGARIVADGLGYTNEVAGRPERPLALRERDLRAAGCRAFAAAPTARCRAARKWSPTSAPAPSPTGSPSTPTATSGSSASSATA